MTMDGTAATAMEGGLAMWGRRQQWVAQLQRDGDHGNGRGNGGGKGAGNGWHNGNATAT